MKETKNIRRVCRVAARGQRGMTLLEIMIVLAIIALVMGFLVGPRVMQMFAESKSEIARIQVVDIANKAYGQWMVNNPEDDCPSSIADLQKYTNNPKKEIKDPWKQDLIMTCGESAPEGVPFGVMSKGPDKKEGTDDDIKSWE